ncbi:MAG: hypothetical protein KDE04_22215, partial [Anaerolineales bacterium]|nr:hypothetical protein [Anaerolineales bacterium]
WAAKKALWLPRFQAVQQFLSDITRTKPLLDSLNKRMLFSPLTRILSNQAVKQGWRRELPRLTEAVPGDAFADLVRQGTLFEDWVEKQHGVQSHRLQWYLIQNQFPGTALALYKEMVHDDWEQTNGRKMWDLVVDSTSSEDDHDFTHPATLERYLNENYQASPRWRNRLASEIQSGADNYQAMKGQLFNQALAQEKDDKPDGPVQANDGRWAGWKKSGNVWRPTIYYPN